MLKPSIEQVNAALNDYIVLTEELKPFVTEKDLVERFILTLHQYHRGETVNISLWLDGVKSDGTRVNTTVFQPVKIVDNNDVTVGYVPPLLVDPTGVLPSEVSEMLHGLFYRAENLDKVIPGRGAAFIKAEVIDKVRDKQTEIDGLRKLWDNLFIKYGLTPVYSDPNLVTETQENNASNKMTEEEFDAEYL